MGWKLHVLNFIYNPEVSSLLLKCEDKKKQKNQHVNDL